jgi:hypothetical protein
MQESKFRRWGRKMQKRGEKKKEKNKRSALDRHMRRTHRKRPPMLISAIPLKEEKITSTPAYPPNPSLICAHNAEIPLAK